ncbi:hypothetical protein [uncultured Paludibaculum sp.]|uniref:hypothetical protein n=1 Tax=uncultured Paludibaculum sp. TaxID=1765020 RepID=UPI002AAAA564|nr:hypothetical protein [uncultured Paludibaculum sp.]
MSGALLPKLGQSIENSGGYCVDQVYPTRRNALNGIPPDVLSQRCREHLNQRIDRFAFETESLDLLNRI